MKKWMIPVFAVGGVATVGAAVLGGMLIFGDKPGMKSPEEVVVMTVQTWLADGDYEEFVSLVRQPMIKEEIYFQGISDSQVQQVVDEAEGYWSQYRESELRHMGNFKGCSMQSLKVTPADENEVEEVKEAYADIEDKVQEVAYATCNLNVETVYHGITNMDFTVRTVQIDDRWYLDILETEFSEDLHDTLSALIDTDELIY